MTTATAAVSDYERFAPFYDRYTAHPAFPGWIRRIEAVARREGVRERWVLDLGCGTGSSFLPLVELGYDVTGVDGSPAMLAEARRKAGARAALHCLDLRELPVLGEFPLVTWLNDGCNCMLSAHELELALRGCAANMARGGVLVFDANTVAAYAGFFSERHARVAGELEFVWEGRTRAGPGCRAEGTLSVFGDGGELLARAEQVQRHHPHRVVAGALACAGLEVVARLGVELEGGLTPAPEPGQPRSLYVAKKPCARDDERRDQHAEGQAADRPGAAGAGIHEGRVATPGIPGAP
jgi:SAM-dependent methyltransferase